MVLLLLRPRRETTMPPTRHRHSTTMMRRPSAANCARVHALKRFELVCSEMRFKNSAIVEPLFVQTNAATHTPQANRTPQAAHTPQSRAR